MSANQEFYFYAEQISVGYGGKPLIENIRMEVKRGEILTLIGPNGAGKSTILKSITRQLELLGGKIWLAGQDMSRLPGKELAKKQAVVLTARMDTEYMTCEEVVASGRYPYTNWLGVLGREDRQKVEEALALVSAEELRERDFSAISDGQRQKILLARAICQEPELVVLDEPTSYLDVKHKLEFLTVLRKLVRERNMAVIMSLHELDLAQKVSDRVLCVCGNRIDRIGTPEEIFKDAYINRLYHVTEGSYHESFACMELERTSGVPQIFVIGGGGSGLSVYRRLARDGVPYAAGVLHRHDIDYEAAKYSAAHLIVEEAYEPICDERLSEALEWVHRCPRVICCLEHFGTMNRANERLYEAAKAQRKLVKNG